MHWKEQAKAQFTERRKPDSLVPIEVPQWKTVIYYWPDSLDSFLLDELMYEPLCFIAHPRQTDVAWGAHASLFGRHDDRLPRLAKLLGLANLLSSCRPFGVRTLPAHDLTSFFQPSKNIPIDVNRIAQISQVASVHDRFLNADVLKDIRPSLSFGPL